MLQIQLIHLLYLSILLAPGIISGAIVTWKTRSAWSLFITIGCSLAGSFVVAISTVLCGKLSAPLLVAWIGSWADLVDFTQVPVTSEYGWFGALPFYILSYLRYSIVAPSGAIAGAALAGMLMLVRYRLMQEGGKFDRAHAWVAGFGSAVVGGILGVCSILLFCWLGWQLLLLANGTFRSAGGNFTTFAQIAWGVSILVNGLVCGLISAVCGMKLAKILM